MIVAGAAGHAVFAEFAVIRAQETCLPAGGACGFVVAASAGHTVFAEQAVVRAQETGFAARGAF